ncbi:MAG: pyridoxal phosphate-dependent aminotransferase [Spirochaetales bacterium]
MNRYGNALEAAAAAPDFINLINTNFHECGLSYDTDALARWSAEYFEIPTLRRYAPDPAGSASLREAVAAWYDARGFTIAPTDLVATASASESYSHIFSGLLKRGAGVVLPRPGYPLFEEVARRCGLAVSYYDLSPDQQWQPDLESLSTALGVNTGALVVISPNNPTGHILSREKSEAVAELCREHDVLLIVDEVFSEYRYESAAGEELPRPAAIRPDIRGFTINGASKLFASPDLKVSWIALSGPERWRAEAREQLEVENDLYLNGSPLSQHLVTRMLESGSYETDRIVGEVARRREVLLGALRRLEDRLPGVVSHEPPAAGIHLPIHIVDEALAASKDDEQLVVSALEEYHLNLHPGYLYGLEEETVLIVSFLSPESVLQEGVARLGELLTRHAV